MKLSLVLIAAFSPIIVNAQYGYGTTSSEYGSSSYNEYGSSSSSGEYPSSSYNEYGTSTSGEYGSSTLSGSVSTSAPSSTATTSSTSSDVTVSVGAKGLTFSPSDFTAANGTIVNFVFSNSVPHSVSQSSFASPCTYLAASGSEPAGFDSGLQTGKQFTIKITNDQTPIWFFCKAPSHCGLGMVGSINAPSSGNTAANFLAAAKAIGANENTITDNGPVTGGLGAIATAPPSATSAGSGSTSAGSGSSAAKSGSSSSPSPKSSGAAGHLVASSVFTFLAAALGITLV